MGIECTHIIVLCVLGVIDYNIRTNRTSYHTGTYRKITYCVLEVGLAA